MVNPNGLYSYRGEEPELITEIVLSSGLKRTNPETFTAEELADAGYTGPFTRPSFNPEIETQAWNSEEQNWVTTPIPDEIFWNRLRNQRNFLLSSTDWVVIKARETSTNVPSAWKDYRQALRDLPANTTDPKNVNWPDLPE